VPTGAFATNRPPQKLLRLLLSFPLIAGVQHEVAKLVSDGVFGLRLGGVEGVFEPQYPLQGVARDNREKYHFCITFPGGCFSRVLGVVGKTRVFIGI
jgi:hypothetical protein